MPGIKHIVHQKADLIKQAESFNSVLKEKKKDSCFTLQSFGRSQSYGYGVEKQFKLKLFIKQNNQFRKSI